MTALVDAQTRVLVQGITGREASMVAAHMLRYGTQLVAGVTPGRGGGAVQPLPDRPDIPVFDTVLGACEATAADAAVVYVPPAAVLDAVLEDLDAGIALIVVVTERVPKHDALRLIHASREAGATVIGPNVTGLICPVYRVKLGPIGGDRPDRCFQPGSVGVVSRSGGMTAECAWTARRAGFGISTAISCGGDALIGTPPATLVRRFGADPQTRAVLLWGEPGTRFEEEVAAVLAAGECPKPLIACIGGRFTEALPEGTVFGHTAALIRAGRGRPTDKMATLRAAGALVADTLDDVPALLRNALGPPELP